MAVYRLQVRYKFPIGTGGGVNTWHYRGSDPSSSAGGPTNMVNALKAFYTTCAPFFGASASVSFDGDWTQVDTQTPALLAPVAPWTVQGQSAANNYGPSGVGLCVSWKTALRSKSGRGRTFIAPLVSGCFGTDGTIEDSNLARARSAAATLVSTSLADGNGALGVWSPTTNLFHDFTAYSISDKVAYLSSRRG
jgi:hypothetical protein